MTRIRRGTPLFLFAILAITASLLGPPFGSALPAGAASSTSSTTTTTAQTCSDVLQGEGASTFEPVMDRLVKDDTPDVAPLCASYIDATLDGGIADFGGTGPSTFAADFAVTERPLTSAEASNAKTDGRNFAYIPIAATPVAIATLVPTGTWGEAGSVKIDPSDFCSGIPLSLTDVADIYGYDRQAPLSDWSDSRIQCSSTGGSVTPEPISLWANNDATMENEVVMNLLDSTPATKTLFDAGLTDSSLKPVATSDTPSESWPYGSNVIPGGDQPLIGKMLNVSPDTNAPDTFSPDWALGATAPISSVWTGSPLGVAWDLPTAAIQNAQGSYVQPNETAAAAAEKDATLAATSDPTTNNLVTFSASPNDAAAYNSYLMLEEYLVVPTNGLSSAKATKLAQFIRFVLGTTGQKDIANFGAAPATSAMVTAGLKVAAEVDAEGLSGATTSGGSSSASGSTSGSSAGSGAATSDSSGGSGDGGTGDSGGSGSALAFTGTNPLPLLLTGGIVVIVAEVCKRVLRRRRLTP